MKIKLDENLPDRLVAVLTGLGHNVDTVRTEQLIGRADPDVERRASRPVFPDQGRIRGSRFHPPLLTDDFRARR